MSNILIVEDEILIADNIQSILENIGYTVVGIESSGIKAIERVKQALPDLILMDINLKGELDGIETATIIKEQYSIPIIYVTSYEDAETLKRAKVTESYGYLLKPLKEKELKITLEMAIYKYSVDQKLAENYHKLRFSQEKFKAIFEYSNDAINLFDPITKQIILYNKRFKDMLGYDDEELNGKSIVDFHPKKYLKWKLEKFKQAENGEVLVIENVPMLRKNGTIFFVDINSYSSQSKEKPFIVGHYRDITERKLFEDQLQESLKYSKNIIDSSLDMIIATDNEGRITEFNLAARLKFQYLLDEIIGNKLYTLFMPIEDSIDVFNETITRSAFYTETVNVCKDGATFLSSISFSVMRDTGGEISGIVGVIRDISQQKMMQQKQDQLIKELSGINEELKMSQEKIIQSEKMASLGQLVAGVAHEINTPIGIALTSSSRLVTMTKEIITSVESKTIKKSELDKFLKDCEQGNDIIARNLLRTADLIKSFKMVAADQTSGARRKFNLKSYIDDIIMSLRPKLKKTEHVIEVQCLEDIVLDSNPGALAQILTNLIMNSLIHGYEADEKGHIIISVEKIKNIILLIYSDNGKGIPVENINKIFDPFFTTKRGSGGTGLGLNIVYNIVNQNLKGTIRCESSIGQGASFILELPISLGQRDC